MTALSSVAGLPDRVGVNSRRNFQSLTARSTENPRFAGNDGRGASGAAKLRPDSELDFAAARLHALEGLREIGEADFFGDKIVSGNIAAANGFESFAEKAGRVVKGGDELKFGGVNGGRIDFDTRAGRQAAEEIHYAASTHHGKRLPPGGGISGGFDDRIRPALVFGKSFDRSDHGGRFRAV